MIDPEALILKGTALALLVLAAARLIMSELKGFVSDLRRKKT